MTPQKAMAIGTVVLLTLMGSTCETTPPTTQQKQAAEARRAANSLSFTDNAEIGNIKKRLELTSKPGLIGFIMLMNEAGQPILYEAVVGKVTSGSKRLTPPSQSWTLSPNNQIGPAPSDEGTWGSSNEYIFYWTQAGEFRQWNGKYLYSDRPFRLRIEPLVVSATAETPDQRRLNPP